MSIPIDQIYCNAFVDTKASLQDSIPYTTLLNNDLTRYELYVTSLNKTEHSIENFLNLKEHFDINKMEKIKVRYDFERNKYFIEKGLHRLSILLYKNIINNTVPIKYLNIEQKNCFYFVIYEHGLKYYDEICEIIKKNEVRIDKKIHLDLPKNKFQEFIFDIYPDTYKDHIISKNKYIIDVSQKKESVRAAIILVSIKNWTYMNDKCKEIELLKRNIRNLYNPKFNDVNKQIQPLNKGVSHDHIIHSIDFPNEFTPIYSVLDKYSNYILLDLLLFFKEMKNYTIIKKDPNFPFYNIGKDDVDILCLNVNETIQHIKTILAQYYDKYTYRFNKENNQLDILLNNKFIFKFDLYDSLTEMYKPYNIPRDLTKTVILNSIMSHNIRVPLLKDELMIRRLEYDKWIHQRPDKKKHIEFINLHPNVKYTIFKK